MDNLLKQFFKNQFIFLMFLKKNLNLKLTSEQPEI